MKYLIATLATLLAPSLAWAETPQALLDQALLLGPAQLGAPEGQPVIFGQAGDAAYVANLGGPDCRTDADGCDTIRFSSFAPAADQAALDAWNAAGNGSQVALDGEWVSLSAEMPVTGNAQAVFANWNALLTQFVQTFEP
ncbi:hypothetical protein [Alterinioella nitratireducens]|uniref:hypothetical protein n=1 Tax=Alterinioella nitratireducens TaxID=2735915 RepID=UPI000C997D75|nr:hypothetical protein [Dinoroseobacter sp.]|tara:strand:+ start:582 stop:1001 length:420 start_codon:yes stop_codon:yes gene_type:complete